MPKEWTYDQVVTLCEVDGVPLPEDLIEWMAEKLTMAANRAWDDGAPSVADAAGAKDAERFLTESDMAALFMFVSQCEDSEADGYTARKETMKRLAEIGCVESKGFGRYAPTMFGLWLIETVFEQNSSLPLLTRADYNAKSAKESGND